MITVSETPAMQEAARVLGCFAGILLALAVVVQVKSDRRPALQLLDGRSEPRESELAAQLLVLALGVTALAATLALIAWIA
jgi:hypothetical protein